MSSKVIAILLPEPAPLRRLNDAARERNMLIDAAQSRGARSAIARDSDPAILSAVQAETLARRFFGGTGA